MRENNTVGAARLKAFFDAGTFVEIGAYISRSGMEGEAEGVTCGYGALDGRLTFAFAQDVGLMKGALDGLHAEKILRTYEKATSVGAPIVGFFDCAGAVVFDGAAALAGVLVGVPVMRLQGDYLAIVTLAFGEIIKNLLNNLWLGWDSEGLHVSMRNANDLSLEAGGKILINGPQGATGIERLSTFTFGFLLIIFTLIVVLNLVNSRSGRAIMAVRDNRIAAESVGISTTKYRLMAFVVSAALAGMAGALYAMNYSSIVPKKFDFNTSINILVFVVLGGMGNIRGGIISATLLTVLPEKLRFLGDLRMLIYAVVLIMVMLVSNNRALQATLQSVVERVRRRRDDDDLVLDSEKGGDA
jgi:branched-chain amino acid transport system permease protein